MACWAISHTATAQTAPTTTQDRQWNDVMGDFKRQSTNGIDSMKREWKRNVAEMQKTLDEVQVTADGKIIAGQQTIDATRQIQKLSEGIDALGKVLDVPAADLQEVRDVVQSMPVLLQQGLELLKSIDWNILGDDKTK